MKIHRKCLVIGIIILFVGASFIPATIGIQKIVKSESNGTDNNDQPLSVMKTNLDVLQKWQADYDNAELAFIDPKLENEIKNTDSFSILDYLDYIPSERDQGWCSNCWAWPATGILGIALYVQKGIFNRLSVQYINSCGEEVGIGCCEGGNLNGFAKFYRYTDMAIPWSNTNADWKDNRAQCKTKCSDIEKIPNYPITKIYARTIKTHKVTESEAINNIKNILHQERGVYFTILYPDLYNLNEFRDFWRYKDEEFIYDLDFYCGEDFVESEAAGHAVLCVGYYDDPYSNDSDYWIMLNSWGTRNLRPNGLFLVDMHIDYDCKHPFGSSYYYAFNAQTLDIEFPEEPEAPYLPTIEGKTSGVINIEYTYKISAIDPQEDNVYYFVDWGDDTDTGWMGAYNSGEEIVVGHTWSIEGSYPIGIKAKDIEDHESDWATLTVTMPRNKAINTLFMRFLEQFPILQKLLLQRLGQK